ncbi:diphthine--ammonia ligase [Polaribacter sp. R2A056_3_33]|uniref:Dph6-related ATP pyrophosphatase n=1 Tax=Polaribacter sp. R2A056_3_33 TaxID=2745563 RepID=UPI001C4F7933|nr:diphthine--ammonia ligase [Polaribacter sp. R2A056_3_33]QXP70447.1 diphthine--ammonia ligase [Polaribacter sp. R2A056_3_33]
MKKTYFNWSSGKDSALALYKILQDPTYNLDLLVTTINKDFNRVSMHGLRNDLLLKQTASIGIDLKTIEFPADVTMDMYAEIMKEAMDSLVEKKYSHTIFGDIFLEDLKTYRDNKLAEVDITGVYPLWKKDTKEVLQEFLALGFKAITVCVNAKLLGEEFVGRVIDEQFIKDLPENVDVCGENGEFHTFVFDGPIFKNPIEFSIGEKVLRSYTLHDNDDDNCHQPKKENSNHDTSFWYCDLS